MTRRNVTMDHVAAAAGVSRQTVSRVLHGNDYVSEATRTRVLEAVRELGFMPDPVARSLARNRTFLLAVLITNFTGPSRAQELTGAEAEAREQGYNIYICGSEASGLGEPLGSALLNLQRYEGLFVLYQGSKSDRYGLFGSIRPGLPVVTTGYGGRNKVQRVLLDNHSGGLQATRHLLSLGHKRIALIAGPATRLDTLERTRGYADALRESGIEADPALQRHGAWTLESGYERTRDLIKAKGRFSAVFVHSDMMALGCMTALKEQGLRIPEDVAVVGFDDIEVARYVDPPLTTVHCPYQQVGRRAVRCLIERITGARVRGGTVVLPTSLVVRRSSEGASEGPPR
jgi:DNA-binding LacI/PurR family transcriptional regulator